MKYKKIKKINVDFWNKYHKTPLSHSNKLAYLAGIVDGEGYLKQEKHGTIRLVIGMTDKKTIYWIRNNFGGSVYKQQKLKSGKLFYVWTLNQGKELIYLYLLLLPFLITKKNKLKEHLIKMIEKFSELDFTLKNLIKK